jgi:hypothetical protein
MKYLNIQKYPLLIISIFVVLALLVILPARALALEYKIANQITLTWTATAPVNAGESIEYAIYIAPESDKTAFTKLWQGPELEYTATLSTEGIFLFGIETYRLVDVGGTITAVSNSAIGWSDDPAVSPTPFGVRHYAPPPMATGFMPK